MPGRLRDPGPDVAGRLRNAPAGESSGASPYDSWTLAQLRARASELRVKGRSRLSRSDLVEAISDAASRHRPS